MSKGNNASDVELQNFREDLQRRGITLLKRLDGGGFGDIFIGKPSNDFAGRYMAIKRVVKDRAMALEAEAIWEYMQRHRGQTNLITVFNNWVIGEGELCYTMELADDAVRREPVPPGGDLAGYSPDTLLARREVFGSAFPLEEIDGYVQGLLAGLAQLERLQLVHRDIKLPNILFLGQQPVLGDLGCLVRADVDLPRGIAGTWDYLSREQRLKADKNRCFCYEDLYQLGEVIFRLALPYSTYCEYVKKCMENARRRELTPVPHDGLTEVAGILPMKHAKLLEDFVTRHACADNPDCRFRSVADFRMAWNRLMERVNNPAKFRRRLVRVGLNFGIGIFLVLVLVQLFFAHRRVAEQGQFDAQQEMRHWLTNHPPQATMTPQADWEMPWERVLFDHGNPNYDPLGGVLSEDWKTSTSSLGPILLTKKGKIRAALPEATQDGEKRELWLWWEGYPLQPEFEIQFLLLSEPEKCEFAISLTYLIEEDGHQSVATRAPIAFNHIVTHAGFFESPEMAREEGSTIEHGVHLIFANHQVVLANDEGIVKTRELPRELEGRRWRLGIWLSATEPGEVSLRHLLLFRPVPKTTGEQEL